MSLTNLLPRMKRWSWSWFRSDAGLPYLLLLAAGTMIGGAALAVQQSWTQRTDATASYMAEQAAQNVADGLQQFDRTLLAVIVRHQSPQVQELDAQARNAAYFDVLQRDPYLVFVDVLDMNGNAIAGRPRDNNNWKDRDYFAALQHNRQDSLFIGGRFSVDNEQAVGVTVSRRMTDGDDNFAGLVVMGVRLAYFRELLGRLAVDTNQSVTLLSDEGVILLRLPFHLNNVGNRLDPGTAFYAALRTGKTSVVAADPVDHVERRFAFRRVGTFPLVVSVGTATTGLFARPMVWWVVAAAGGIVAVALATWWRMAAAAVSS